METDAPFEVDLEEEGRFLSGERLFFGDSFPRRFGEDLSFGGNGFLKISSSSSVMIMGCLGDGGGTSLGLVIGTGAAIGMGVAIGMGDAIGIGVAIGMGDAIGIGAEISIGTGTGNVAPFVADFFDAASRFLWICKNTKKTLKK